MRWVNDPASSNQTDNPTGRARGNSRECECQWGKDEDGAWSARKAIRSGLVEFYHYDTVAEGRVNDASGPAAGRSGCPAPARAVPAGAGGKALVQTGFSPRLLKFERALDRALPSSDAMMAMSCSKMTPRSVPTPRGAVNAGRRGVA